MKRLFIFIAIIGLFSCSSKNNFKLNSPDGKITVVINTENGVSISQLYEGDTIIGKSIIGLQIGDEDLTKGVVVTNAQMSEFDETWEAVNGKNKTVRNHYNQFIIDFSKAEGTVKSYQLVVRCFNDGFAYRYIVENSDNKNFKINAELTKLQFKNDFTYWAYNHEHHNLGPLTRSESPMEKVETPMVLQIKDDLFMGIHEAEIIRYAPLFVKADLDGFGLGINITPTEDNETIKTSWRSFIIGNNAGDLVESDLLVNLNEPCKIEDTSWIKPGRSLWDWRVWGYKAADGFEYGLNTVSHKRFIDFAAANNIQNLLIDADWYGPEFSEDSDPTAARDGVNIEECMAYAKEKGVGVILYLNDVGAKKFGLERVLKQFADWGAVGVKYGFMMGNWEEKVRHTRKVVELCAQNKLMVDFHDHPVPPSGDRRTYPNLVTKEFCHAQADAKRSYWPETAVSSPFINMIAGPLDYTDGWFDLNNAHSRVRVFEEIPGTVAAEVAKLIVAYTGWKVLPDSPEEYLKKDDLFDCIRKMPNQFDNYKVLDGTIGNYMVVARQAGDNWFIGSLTNREGRVVEINFSFLPKDKKYKATIYGDADDTNFLNNKEAYKVETIDVSADSVITVKLAPGGGNSIYLEAI